MAFARLLMSAVVLTAITGCPDGAGTSKPQDDAGAPRSDGGPRRDTPPDDATPPDVADASMSSAGRLDPIGPGWVVGQECMREMRAPGQACTYDSFGDIDPTFPNPCPNNCIRNNHNCTWICRPTCEPNPDACGPDPCQAHGYGQCAGGGVCWPYSRCTCVAQGACADCASAPCP